VKRHRPPADQNQGTYVRTAEGAEIVPADLSDRTDFDNANRGLVARLEPGIIKAADGKVVYDADSYTEATAGPCPDTVNPSLWRQSQLTAIQGLFEVTEGIYQLRGIDLSNMTVVEGDTGVIVIDPPRCRPPGWRCTASTAATVPSER
jgi:alkyl sulfatase BDS1-like metallo-beta-lactamase superfamily hydrolase